jgi:hypothetical protein
MEIKDILMLGTTTFTAKEEKEIQMANFRTKPKTTLSAEIPLDLNSFTRPSPTIPGATGTWSIPCIAVSTRSGF